jgi:glycosyltransferase involved in cell wall biosynthesis
MPLHKEILKQGGLVKWFVDETETKKHVEDCIDLLESPRDVLDYDAHINLVATNMIPDFFPGIKVQVFHGFSVDKRSENKGHFRLRGIFDLYCTQGPSTTERFLALKKKHQYFEVIETGWSKVDPLFPIEESEVSKKPTILIASTFTKRLSLAHDTMVVDELARLSKKGHWHFLAVLHPKMDHSIVSRFKNMQHAAFTFYDTTDLIPLFKRADIMFADTTSAIPEFLLQEKPVVTYRNNKPNDHIINIEDVSAIESTLHLALSRPPKMITNIRHYIEKIHPYKDGKSSMRVIAAAIAFLNQEKKYLRSKPKNLIRKFKVRKKLKYFTFKSFTKPKTFELSNPKDGHREKITAIIPVGNEEHNIRAVLESVKFADELMVVDSFSTDKTLAIAKEYTDFIIQREYQNSASQKNWAIPQASHEWILLVDADERVTAELQQEIIEILKNPPKDNTTGYWIYRMNHFMGKRVYYSGWKNDKVIRLFKKNACKYEEKHVHAEIITAGKVGYLKHKFYHNTYTTLDNHIKKLNRYAAWQAHDYDKKTGRITPFHFVIKPFWGFFKHFILQLGFKDGFVGLTISFLHSYSIFMRYAKLWLLRRHLK